MRPGPGLLAGATIVLLTGLGLLMSWNARRPGGGTEGDEVVVFCAAGLRLPVEEAARAFEREHGGNVTLNYGGSGSLVAQIVAAGRGDLFIPGDEGYLDSAAKQVPIRERIPLAKMTPVLAVRRGNPHGITGLKDLEREDISIGLANPDAAAIGQLVRGVLTRSNDWGLVQERCRVMKPTVTELGNDLVLGTIDVAVLWDATVAQLDEVEAVHDPRLAGSGRNVTAGVVGSSEHPTAALRFARFLGARDRGLESFARHGYEIVDGDTWSYRPRLVLYSGAMLRPGIEETVRAFAEREGVDVETIFNGCGILVAQLRAGGRADGYLTCDASFLDMVANDFGEPRELSSNDMVIVVPRSNPKALRSALDLSVAGLRVGLAHPEKSALGTLTRRALTDVGLWKTVWESRVVDSPTGDMLVNQVQTGSLDAAVVYRSNARASRAARERLDIVELGIGKATAVQNRATARDCEHPRTMERLFDAIESPDTRERMEALGFEWRATPR